MHRKKQTNNQTKQKQTKATKQNRKQKKQKKIKNRKNPKKPKTSDVQYTFRQKKIIINKHGYFFFFFKLQIFLKITNEYVYSKFLILLCFILI